jgi:hypothetical protein
MKNITKNLTGCMFSTVILLTSCGQGNPNENRSGSESQTTATDSSGAESRKALGVGEGNQKDVAGYPSNQSNLNSDSTSRLHDDDTTSKKPLKDKPNKHQ